MSPDRGADRQSGASVVDGGMALLLRLYPWLLPLFVVVLLGLGLLTLGAYSVNRNLEDARIAQSDNATWLLSQVEVDLLKLQTAADALLLKPRDGAAMRLFRQRFDVFLSRVKVVDGNMHQNDWFGSENLHAKWDEVLAHTAALTLLLDVPDNEVMSRLPTIMERLDAAATPVRDFAVISLGLLVKANGRDREALQSLLTSFAVVALSLITLLLGTTWVMVRLLRQIERRSLMTARIRSNLEKAIASSLDAVIVVGADGRILQFNPAAEKIFGYSRDEMMGAGFAEVLIPDRPDDPQVAQVRDFLRTWRGDLADQGRIVLHSLRRNGSEFPVELVLTADRDSDGQTVFFAFLRDISERMQIETSLKTARDAAVHSENAKSKFLAVMSHEMRTPMNGVIAALDILRETTELTEKQERFLAIAHASSMMALDQINDVLELTRLDDAELSEEETVFNLTRLITEAAEQHMPLARKKGNRIVLDLPPEAEADVKGYRRIFLRTLLNLLGNAGKFTTAGSIRIRARIEPQEACDLVLRVEVSDTGIGIPEDKLERVFDIFETIENGYDRNGAGTGLGLGIARRAVEHMGGTISVESRQGEGSTFRFSARMKRPPIPVPDRPREVRPKRRETGQESLEVLIVEDNHTNRIVLREMLEHLGHRVTEAENGSLAVRLAQERDFDLILMDISMPVMDGLEATREIRSGGASASSRIVGLTAHGLPDEVARFAETGLPELLRKPLTFAALVRLLASVIPAGTRRAAAGDSELDVAILRDLTDVLSRDTVELALTKFYAEADQSLAQIRLALTEERSSDMTEIAHRLHGAAAMFGARGLALHMTRLELDLRLGRMEMTAGRIVAAEQSLAQLRPRIAAVLEMGDDPAHQQAR